MVVVEASVKLLPAPGSVSGFTTCAAAGKFQSLFPRELDLRYQRKGIEFCVFISSHCTKLQILIFFVVS